MRAIVYERYGPPEVLELRELPRPVPRAHELLIKVRAVSVTSGDVRLRSLDVPPGFGLVARLAFGILRPRQPVLGIAIAGIVTAVGDEVSRFTVGDAVFGMSATHLGGYGEYRVLPESSALAEIPDDMSFEEAAALPFGGTTALQFLRRAAIRAGERVLVVGASGDVGSRMVQIAKHLGAHVTGVSSTANLELVRSLGADAVIDYTSTDLASRNERYDIVVDTVGGVPVTQWLGLLRDRGRLLLLVASAFDLLAIPWVLLTTNKRVIAGPANERADDVKSLADLARRGALPPLIDRVYALDQMAAAHTYVESKRKRGSVIVTFAHREEHAASVMNSFVADCGDETRAVPGETHKPRLLVHGHGALMR